MQEEIIGSVSRPSRYIGSEINAVHKDHGLVDVKVALAFPDTYEIGMSHIGLKILYDILNKREDTVAERTYAPWKDMEAVLRAEGQLLTTLESDTPLAAFDLVGFSLQYEMSYTNILTMLDLGGIPLFASQRGHSHPWVIGGGPCAFNPEPLADFFDFFIIGDGEEIIEEILDVYRSHRTGSKDSLLKQFTKLEGVYVPSHFQVNHRRDGRISAILNREEKGKTVRKRIVKDLNRAPYPCAPILPYMRIVHDRVPLEISRGCTQGCRFCQAGIIYRPVRERDVEPLVQILKESVRHTGYGETSLTSLSSGDYTCLASLIEEVVEFAEERHIGVSLPSLRPGTLTSEIIEEIRRIRKTGFTIAPEAGTQRLRDVINKGIREDDLLDTVQKVFRAGWEALKLYFMIGLPTETEEDLEGIVRLTQKALKVARAINPRLKRISVSLSPFVPKAHTPFQWCVQNGPEEIRAKYAFLKKRLKNRKIHLKWHEPEISMLEGIFSRGDRKIGQALFQAWKNGCRFDGWTEEFNFTKWEKAFVQAGIDPGFYLYRVRSVDEVLPWDHIETGITKGFLLEEYGRSQRAELTPDCREGSCSSCGVCTKEVGNRFLSPPASREFRKTSSSRRAPSAVKRFRVRYTKEGRLRFLSHLEMISLLARAFARASIPLEHSKGFHPHPKIAMGPALPVGVEGKTEFMDVTIEGTLFEEHLADRLNRVLPSGVRVTGVNWIPPQAPAISSIIRFGEYLLRIPTSLVPQSIPEKIRGFLGREQILVMRKLKGAVKTLDMRPMIEEMEVVSTDEKSLELRILVQTGDQGGLRPDEVVRELFHLQDEDLQRIRIIRTGLFTDREKSAPFQEKMVQPV